MLYLLLAIASSALVSIFMRLSERHVCNEMGMFMANYAVCTLFSFFFLNGQYVSKETFVGFPILGLGIISGCSYLITFIFMKFNMKHNGMVLTSTFTKLGVLIPTLMAIAVFHERPRWSQAVGIVISLIAIVMIHFEKEAVKEGNKKIWLLLLLVLNGVTDAMANIYEQIGMPEGKDSYLVVTFFTAFLLAFILTIRDSGTHNFRNNGHGKLKLSKIDMAYGILIGIPNYFSARFLLLALGSVEAVLVYPMFSVATMIVITIVGIVAFHEKISRKKACALCLIMAALVLLNV